MQNISLGALSITVLIPLGSCFGGLPPEVAALYKRIQGVWISDGYGYVLELTEDNQRILHIAGNACWQDPELTRSIGEIVTPDTFFSTSDPKTAYLANKHEPHRTFLHRQDKVPKACASEVENTVAGNFEAFVEVMRADYAFFDLYSVDWESQVKAARASLSPDMSDADLFALFASMIEPLQDGHLTLSAEIDGNEVTYSPDRTVLGDVIAAQSEELEMERDEVMIDRLLTHLKETIEDGVLGGKGKTVSGGKLQYGVIEDDIGYINPMLLVGYYEDNLIPENDAPDDDAEHEAINDYLDDIIALFLKAGVKAVVIDLTTNFGGHDYVGRQIAQRFGKTRGPAYSKYAYRADASPETTVYFEPSLRPAYHGPVYVLTSEETASAAEIMTMSLRSQPNVTHLGQATNGALSDVLDKPLPNGWTLGLSNEIYQDAKGNKWEGIGITPDVSIPLPEGLDILRGHSEVMKRLIAYIRTDLS